MWGTAAVQLQRVLHSLRSRVAAEEAWALNALAVLTADTRRQFRLAPNDGTGSATGVVDSLFALVAAGVRARRAHP